MLTKVSKYSKNINIGKYNFNFIYMEAFIWILFFKILSWTESSKEQNLFEIRMFCNIANVFAVISDQ